jgi:hypothetical protein
MNKSISSLLLLFLESHGTPQDNPVVMPVLSITRLGDEDIRLMRSHNPDIAKMRFQALAQAIVWAMRKNGDMGKILINCSAGMNRSATLACVVISMMKSITFSGAMKYLEKTRAKALRDGSLVPNGYFLSSGGAYFRDLFSDCQSHLSPSKRRRQSLESKPISIPTGRSYDMKRDAYTLELLDSEFGKTTLYIGNLLAAQQPGFDLVVDLSGKAKTDGAIQIPFHECSDADTLISEIARLQEMEREQV